MRAKGATSLPRCGKFRGLTLAVKKSSISAARRTPPGHEQIKACGKFSFPWESLCSRTHYSRPDKEDKQNRLAGLEFVCFRQFRRKQREKLLNIHKTGHDQRAVFHLHDFFFAEIWPAGNVETQPLCAWIFDAQQELRQRGDKILMPGKRF